MFEFDYMEALLFPSFLIFMALVIAGIGFLAVKGGK
jgi:hypothetical protein